MTTVTQPPPTETTTVGLPEPFSGAEQAVEELLRGVEEVENEIQAAEQLQAREKISRLDRMIFTNLSFLKDLH